MSNPLSERLRQTADLVEFFEIPDDRVDEVVELMREAAALARRVEGATLPITVQRGSPYDQVGVILLPNHFAGETFVLVPVETPPSTEGGEDGSR